MAKPPLELAVEVTDSTGRVTRWDGNARRAGDIPKGITFGTKRGDGFADGPNITLNRRIDRDWPDINLYDDVRLIGVDGTIAYEGYISANPRSFDGGHTTSIRVAGPMTLAQRRPFSEVYIERDMSKWGASPNQRKASLIQSGYQVLDAAQEYDPSGNAALATQATAPWSSAAVPFCEAWYQTPSGVAIGSLYWEFEEGANVVTATQGTDTNVGDPNFTWQVMLGQTPFNLIDTTDDLNPDVFQLGGGGNTATKGTLDAGPKRNVASLQFYYAAAASNSAQGVQYVIYWRNIAVIGDHGLTLNNSSTPGPGGIFVSDMIYDICQRYAPKLDPSGIQPTSYPVDQAAFEQVQPYDAWLQLNKFHLWELNVWENKQLCFYPANLDTYDWQIRLDDPGVTIDLPGDSTETLANGIVVSYLDITTGRIEVLSPDTTPELQDPNPLNLATLHNEIAWTTLDLSSIAMSAADATQTGISALAEFNQAKAAGTIKVKGHIRDSAGRWQQAWKVRASQTIAIIDHPDDRPRLIGETTWDQDSLTLTIAVDNTLTTVDAFIDRATTALKAANLGAYPT